MKVKVCGLAAVVVLAACMEQVPAAPSASFDHVGPLPEHGHVVVCKEGTDADFDLVVDGVASQFSLTDGECLVVAEAEIIPNQPTPKFPVTVNEIVRVGTQLDEITVDSMLAGQPTVQATVTGTSSHTVQLFDDIGWVLTFHNSYVQAGGEGCTPGYWKQRHHFDSWEGYHPDDLFSSVFVDAFPGKTLHEVLKLKKGGLNRLGSHTVAALLNSASSGVQYDYTTADVIQMFAEAIANGNYEETKDLFAESNELGCLLN